MDELEDLGERGHVELNALVVFGCGLAEGEVFGEEDVHGFGEEAGAREVFDVLRPLFGAVAGLFDELAFGGGDELFAGFDAAGREFEEELASGVAVLADEEDIRVGRVGFGVDREDDDRAIVADNVAGGVDAAGFGDFVAGDEEDLTLVDGLRGEGASFAGKLLCSGHDDRVKEVSVHRREVWRIQRGGPL